MMRGAYIDISMGQIHYRYWRSQPTHRRPLLCLHPAPFSGLFFTTAMPLLGHDREVFAPDYPGYGGSTEPDEQPTIEDYAQCMLEFIDALGIDTTVDVIGFHTGCLVGAEMLRLRPVSINTLVMVDVPYFDSDAQESLRSRAAAPLNLSPQADSIGPVWESDVGKKAAAIGMTRAVELFSEHVRGYKRAHQAFHAAFTYPCVERFAGLSGPLAIIATQSMLLDATRAAAQAVPAAHFVEALDITQAVFEEGAEAITGKIDAAIRALEEDHHE